MPNSLMTADQHKQHAYLEAYRSFVQQKKINVPQGLSPATPMVIDINGIQKSDVLNKSDLSLLTDISDAISKLNSKQSPANLAKTSQQQLQDYIDDFKKVQQCFGRIMTFLENSSWKDKAASLEKDVEEVRRRINQFTEDVQEAAQNSITLDDILKEGYTFRNTKYHSIAEMRVQYSNVMVMALGTCAEGVFATALLRNHNAGANALLNNSITGVARGKVDKRSLRGEKYSVNVSFDDINNKDNVIKGITPLVDYSFKVDTKEGIITYNISQKFYRPKKKSKTTIQALKTSLRRLVFASAESTMQYWALIRAMASKEFKTADSKLQKAFIRRWGLQAVFGSGSDMANGFIINNIFYSAGFIRSYLKDSSPQEFEKNFSITISKFDIDDGKNRNLQTSSVMRYLPQSSQSPHVSTVLAANFTFYWVAKKDHFAQLFK